MRILMQAVVRVGIVGAITVTQIGAAPRKKEPYVTSWYLHAQRLVDVGGRRLNILCTGTGSPVVVLDAGLGADLTAWRFVQPAIARHTRVCSYDRAGMGFSDPTTSPRDAAAMVNDLHALLRGASISPPYVLVGWSMAGLYTRLYTDRYFNNVVGLVQIDPSSEYDDDYMLKHDHDYMRKRREWYKQLDDCSANVSEGTCALFPGGLAGYRKKLRASGCPQADPQNCAVEEVQVEHAARASYWRDFAREAEASTQSSAEVRNEQRPYGDLPLIVLTESEQSNLQENESDPDPRSTAQHRAAWIEENHVHDRIARSSSRGAHFVVDGSGHDIQKDRPSAVISAVDEVVDQARYGKHSERSSQHSVP